MLGNLSSSGAVCSTAADMYGPHICRSDKPFSFSLCRPDLDDLLARQFCSIAECSKGGVRLVKKLERRPEFGRLTSLEHEHLVVKCLHVKKVAEGLMALARSRLDQSVVD